MSKVVKLNKDQIISGTESSYVLDTEEKKPTKKEVKTYMKKFEDYKKDYIKKNSIESMVYENGSALALLYKEIMRLNQLLTTKLNSDEEKNGK